MPGSKVFRTSPIFFPGAEVKTPHPSIGRSGDTNKVIGIDVSY